MCQRRISLLGAACILLLQCLEQCYSEDVLGMYTPSNDVCASGQATVPPSSSTLPELADLEGIRRWRAEHLPPVLTARCSDEDGELSAHQLVYIHVMKTGGLFLDAIITQNCEQMQDVGCYISHHEGWNIFYPKGDHVAEPGEDVASNCDNNAPILTTHGHAHLVIGKDAECGSGFVQSSIFTLLREPVARLFSLYRYEGRDEDSSYRSKSLLQVLEENEAGVELGPNDCNFCKTQWSNKMVHQLSTADVVHSDDEQTQLRKHLESAKANLAFHMTVVGLTERMDNTTALLHHKLPVWFKDVSLKEPVNVTPATPAELVDLWVLDDATKAKLVELNTYDVELYNFAVQLFEMEMQGLSS